VEFLKFVVDDKVGYVANIELGNFEASNVGDSDNDLAKLTFDLTGELRSTFDAPVKFGNHFEIYANGTALVNYNYMESALDS
jgi:hypothetical protein